MLSFRVVLGRGGIQLCLSLSLVMLDDVGPKLDQRCANHPFRSDSCSTLKSLPDPAVCGRVVCVGNAACNEVPDDIGVVWTIATIVPSAPDGSRHVVENAMSD